MQQPGWYTDPSGQPGRFRFWDGQHWTSATTTSPATPHPRPAPATTAPSGAGSTRTLLVGALVAGLVVLLVGVGIVQWTRGTPTPPPVNPTSPVSPTAPLRTPDLGAALTCTGGNTNVTRSHQPRFHSTGIVYDSVPDWKFSFDPSYWTWLDDHSALGAIRLDGGTNEAGIALGGVRFDQGFADQATAGERAVACLEGTLSVDEPTRAGSPTTVETTLGGMTTFHTSVEFTSGSMPEPLLVDIYVIDAEQGAKWAQLITFQRPNSEAAPLIARAVESVRRG